jgi:hypothetical protein
VLQLALSGQGLSEQRLNNYGLNFIRTQLVTEPGAPVPYPLGYPVDSTECEEGFQHSAIALQRVTPTPSRECSQPGRQEGQESRGKLVIAA